jgi:hypothetical protein
MLLAQRYPIFSFAVFCTPQGSLAPTAAPADDEVAPASRGVNRHRPVAARVHASYTISQPGSYYLAGNLNASGTNGETEVGVN